MNLHQVWPLIRRWAWLVVLAGCLAAATSYLVSVRLPKVYQGTARILVSPGQAGTAPGEQYNDVLAAERLTLTYSEVIRSRPIVMSVVNQLNLNLYYDDALKLIDANPVRDTQLIEISAREADPDLAASFANSLAQSFIDSTAAMQTSRYQSSLDSLNAQVGQLSAEIADRSAQIDVLRTQPASAARDADLARSQGDLTQLQQSYSTAVQSLEQDRIAAARGTDQLAVVDPASPSVIPVQPRVTLDVVLAAVAGLVLAVAAACLLEHLDDRLFSAERLQRYTKLHMLGAIANLPADAPRTIDRLPQTDPHSEARTKRGNHFGSTEAAEAFRLLQANLQFAAVERPLRTLLVTSTDTGDGKTTTAGNVAIAFAQSGKRVLIVDADLRRPSQHELFGLPNRLGLTYLLVNESLSPTMATVPTRVPNLRLLSAGAQPPNPGELLASHRMRIRLQELIADYDIVVIDSPPVRATSDPAILAGLADGTLLVVNANGTRGQNAATAVATLQKAGAHVLGAVLNKVERDASSYYGYYYYLTRGTDAAAPSVPQPTTL